VLGNEIYPLKVKQTPRNFRSSIFEIKEDEPEKSELLLKLYDDLLAKTALPSLRDIHEFLADTELPPLKATSRSKAIVPLIKTLMTLQMPDLRAKLSKIESLSTQDDRSLEGWSNIILNKDQRNLK
ncbi:MAG: hypothetical protein M3511_11095, partial [Deinococcota bacterium]|nr:hypothetical protein [Deinococcota bacterium]